MALRSLRRNPGFAFTAVLILALGIAANVIVFGVLDAMVLRTLNLPHPLSEISMPYSIRGNWRPMSIILSFNLLTLMQMRGGFSGRHLQACCGANSSIIMMSSNG